MRNSSLEACGDGREIAERFVEDGDEIGGGIVYGGEGDGAVGGPGGTDFVGEEGEFGGVFEELLRKGVSFGFFFFFFCFGMYKKGRGFLYYSPNTSHPKATSLSSRNRPSRSNSHSNRVGLLIMSFPFRHCAM